MGRLFMATMESASASGKSRLGKAASPRGPALLRKDSPSREPGTITWTRGFAAGTRRVRAKD